MEEPDEKAQQRRETFALYGLTMYHAQCVEKSLAILVSGTFNSEFGSLSAEQQDEMIDRTFARTLGRLLDRMRKQITIPPHLDDLLTKAHQKRNWLAHNYFMDRSDDILTTNGRNKMMDELNDLYQFFKMVDSKLTPIYEDWIKKIGLQPFVDKEVAKIVRD